MAIVTASGRRGTNAASPMRMALNAAMIVTPTKQVHTHIGHGLLYVFVDRLRSREPVGELIAGVGVEVTQLFVEPVIGA